MVLWKERSHIGTVTVLAIIAIGAIFAEIEIGILELLLDPFIGPIVIAALILIMIPIHLLISRIQAKLILPKLSDKQKELNLIENLANVFEKNLRFSRMLLPTTEPSGWNRKTRVRLAQLTEKAKDLVQILNDYFSLDTPSHSSNDFL
ncbi:hypothetical protein [Methylocucumis oryzae]|uniref:hypothetical protein n=1 Tax=Methylocucumis oryzae TaxID=1632867 RepID=UPI001EF9D48D|nr:hypothetical protein [Methylocucumis oryzae]